jgi:hypothetical protein
VAEKGERREETHSIESRPQRSDLNLRKPLIPLQGLQEVLLLRSLVDYKSLLLRHKLDNVLVFLSADVKFVDEVPEEFEGRRTLGTEDGEVALVVVEKGVDRLPGRAGGDVTGGDEFVKKGL